MSNPVRLRARSRPSWAAQHSRLDDKHGLHHVIIAVAGLSIAAARPTLSLACTSVHGNGTGVASLFLATLTWGWYTACTVWLVASGIFVITGASRPVFDCAKEFVYSETKKCTDGQFRLNESRHPSGIQDILYRPSLFNKQLLKFCATNMTQTGHKGGHSALCWER